MPIYEYQCEHCSHQLETLQKISEAPLRDCPRCGKPGLRKLVSAAGFQLKGAGWYATDFKDSGKKKAAEKPAAESGSAGGDKAEASTPAPKAADGSGSKE